MNDDQFLEEFFEVIQKDVDAALKNFSPEELRSFVRDFSQMILKYIGKHEDIEADPLRSAAEVLYLTKLFPKAFLLSYNHTDKMMQAKDSIRKALEDL